jgi:DNA-binding XRE family transcriptional regulator
MLSWYVTQRARWRGRESRRGERLVVKKLVQVREERGWSQRRPAREAKVHLNTIWKTETEQSHPSYEISVKVARALGLDPREIAEFGPVVRAAEDQGEEGWPLVVRRPSATTSDREFAEREGLESLVEAEAANTTQVSPDEQDIWSNPELVRVGLTYAMRAMMRHFGVEDTLRAFRTEFGEREALRAFSAVFGEEES